MSALDVAVGRLEKQGSGAYLNSEVTAETLKGAGIVAQAAEQRIANLIALLPHVAPGAKQGVLDDLAKRLGIRELF